MLRRKYSIRLFVIDYLQLIEGDDKHTAETVKNNIFALKSLVNVESDISVVVLSQYSKSEGFAKKKRRTKNDLQWGSAIHQAAHNVVLITIENPDKKEKNDLLDVEFAIEKQREGRVGKVTTMWDRDHLRFVDPQPILSH